MSKIALSSDDDKRLQTFDNITSYPYETNAFSPIQDGGEGGGVQKVPPTRFSPVTSTNVRISPQNLLTFNLDPFDRLV